MELTWKQAHMLGDSPDVMDVSMVFTPAIRYVQNRQTFITGIGGGQNGRENGSDFDFVLREAYLEMANVFKAAPEITFWGGQRFYDRFNIDSNDYFWLDLSVRTHGIRKLGRNQESGDPSQCRDQRRRRNPKPAPIPSRWSVCVECESLLLG